LRGVRLLTAWSRGVWGLSAEKKQRHKRNGSSKSGVAQSKARQRGKERKQTGNAYEATWGVPAQTEIIVPRKKGEQASTERGAPRTEKVQGQEVERRNKRTKRKDRGKAEEGGKGRREEARAKGGGEEDRGASVSVNLPQISKARNYYPRLRAGKGTREEDLN